MTLKESNGFVVHMKRYIWLKSLCKKTPSMKPSWIYSTRSRHCALLYIDQEIIFNDDRKIIHIQIWVKLFSIWELIAYCDKKKSWKVIFYLYSQINNNGQSTRWNDVSKWLSFIPVHFIYGPVNQWYMNGSY